MPDKLENNLTDAQKTRAKNLEKKMYLCLGLDCNVEFLTVKGKRKCPVCKRRDDRDGRQLEVYQDSGYVEREY